MLTAGLPPPAQPSAAVLPAPGGPECAVRRHPEMPPAVKKRRPAIAASQRRRRQPGVLCNLCHCWQTSRHPRWCAAHLQTAQLVGKGPQAGLVQLQLGSLIYQRSQRVLQVLAGPMARQDLLQGTAGGWLTAATAGLCELCCDLNDLSPVSASPLVRPCRALASECGERSNSMSQPAARGPIGCSGPLKYYSMANQNG